MPPANTGLAPRIPPVPGTLCETSLTIVDEGEVEDGVADAAADAVADADELAVGLVDADAVAEEVGLVDADAL